MLSTEQKNKVLISASQYIEVNRESILSANQRDLQDFALNDVALKDRLYVNQQKIDDMITSLLEVASSEDPVGKLLYALDHANGMTVENRSCPFGKILIIYESRPDVTVEAAAIAFKAGNKIALKGGKESQRTNLELMKCWHSALTENNVASDYIQYLALTRSETQELLKNAQNEYDLIVPRGGDLLIQFVRQNATCPVIVSGRGNNFLYVHEAANQDKAINVIINAKTSKISACNALDKVLIDNELPDKLQFADLLIKALKEHNVLIKSTDPSVFKNTIAAEKSDWETEYLDNIIMLSEVAGIEDAINKINTHSGKHSATIMTETETIANDFMEKVDAAAVYHNVSTRFTDGGSLGLGAELAISTDKLHHRGPLGTQHLVSNKWYIKGNGQIR
ncbi:MAG: glutamate-5-semialdehyde dehydrogenase [Saprospiraceae bacterium]|nr:glutamate-5-semialdehyde dehydrogenase [Saprospiraceae bacterium]